MLFQVPLEVSLDDRLEAEVAPTHLVLLRFALLNMLERPESLALRAVPTVPDVLSKGCSTLKGRLGALRTRLLQK